MYIISHVVTRNVSLIKFMKILGDHHGQVLSYRDQVLEMQFPTESDWDACCDKLTKLPTTKG